MLAESVVYALSYPMTPVLDRDGGLVECFDLLHGRAMPPADAHWIWVVAPFGEESAETRRVHSVAAWLAWRGAARRD